MPDSPRTRDPHAGPKDFSETAVAVVDFIIEKYDPAAAEAESTPESPQAEAGRKGGKARASRLTPEERSESARRAARARWGTT